MSTESIHDQPSPYPTQREVTISLIERAILEFRSGMLVFTHKPRYQINVVTECAILLLIGFKETDFQGELIGYYRGLMEQALSIEEKGGKSIETKRLAQEVYEDMLARKVFLDGIYRQEQSMVDDCKIEIGEGSVEKKPTLQLPKVSLKRGRFKM
jgi:hypothetical protein